MVAVDPVLVDLPDTTLCQAATAGAGAADRVAVKNSTSPSKVAGVCRRAARNAAAEPRWIRSRCAAVRPVPPPSAASRSADAWS
ncbi:hypothetical protein ACYAFX_14375 [Rhodococcus aetherivorans]